MAAKVGCYLSIDHGKDFLKERFDRTASFADVAAFQVASMNPNGWKVLNSNFSDDGFSCQLHNAVCKMPVLILTMH